MRLKDYILVMVILIIPVVIYSFILKVQPCDELVNFLSIAKMTDGYTIYKDFNVIITPLFFIIGAFFQKIFGNYLIVFRIYNVIICYIFYFAFYKLIKKLGVQKNIQLLGLLIFIIFTMNMMINSANYNILATAFYMIGIIFALNEHSKKNSFILGIIAYLCFMTKQNIGVFFIIALIISDLFNYKKDTLVNIVIQIATFLVLILISIVGFLIEDNLSDFINYTFFNLHEFALQNFGLEAGQIGKVIIMLLVAFVVNILFMIKMLKEKEAKEYKLFVFGIMIYFSLVPIINTFHIYICITITVAELVILIDSIFRKDIKDEDYEKRIKELGLISIDKIITIMNVIIYLLIVLNVISIAGYYKSPVIETNKKSPYYLCIIDRSTKQKLESVCQYILAEKDKSKNVIIFSADTSLYMPVLKLNNGDIDLPFYRKFRKRWNSWID